MVEIACEYVIAPRKTIRLELLFSNDPISFFGGVNACRSGTCRFAVGLGEFVLGPAKASGKVAVAIEMRFPAAAGRDDAVVGRDTMVGCDAVVARDAFITAGRLRS